MQSEPALQPPRLEHGRGLGDGEEGKLAVEAFISICDLLLLVMFGHVKEGEEILQMADLLGQVLGGADLHRAG